MLIVVEQFSRFNELQLGDLEQSIFEFNIETPTEMICFVESIFPTWEDNWEIIKFEIFVNCDDEDEDDEVGKFSTFTWNVEKEFAFKISNTDTWHNNNFFTPSPTGRIDQPKLDSDLLRTTNHLFSFSIEEDEEDEDDWKEYWKDNGKSSSISVQLNEENKNWVEIATPSEGETTNEPDWGGKFTTTSKLDFKSFPSIDKLKI